ncbi:ComEA family DNA-binding protein [Mesorhizobium sp. ES1-4]|uniref:ComEA family DNA-binding protein n=1 Tax=Mesorhizobium sp. ES1-4 TaxID=2876627 RepID=UPI001CCC1360|nr:helix-hairpin-helix domain-containing protein [Mesorhizobium sp. ES1-4]MBZ9799470.1 helix-hairpin-helix domain-containing protein [Mesorhizobium sp. ES1-4]
MKAIRNAAATQHDATAHHAGQVLDINSASQDELAALPGLDAQLARQLCHSRPFKRWAEVEALEGFDAALVERLKAGPAAIRTL